MSLAVSVVIPVRNDAVMLERCLAALARQTRRPDEIVVVDNGSTDRSAEIAAAAGARVVTESRPGIPFAAATGYDSARGDLIARIDADTVCPPDWLERAERHFLGDPELAALTGNATFYGATELVHRLGEAWYIGGMYWSMTWYLGHPPLFGSNLAMRADFWRSLSGEVHRRTGIHDDLDLSLHVKPGTRIVYDPAWVAAISARPFATAAGLIRRLAWVIPTLRNHDGPFARHAAWRRAAEEETPREALT